MNKTDQQQRSSNCLPVFLDKIQAIVFIVINPNNAVVFVRVFACKYMVWFLLN